jgi:hypothetical protein
MADGATGSAAAATALPNASELRRSANDTPLPDALGGGLQVPPVYPVCPFSARPFRACLAAAEYDQFSTIAAHLDAHLVIPVLDFLAELKVRGESAARASSIATRRHSFMALILPAYVYRAGV